MRHLFPERQLIMTGNSSRKTTRREDAYHAGEIFEEMAMSVSHAPRCQDQHSLLVPLNSAIGGGRVAFVVARRLGESFINRRHLCPDQIFSASEEKVRARKFQEDEDEKAD